MKLEKAIELLAREAFGHAHTAGLDWYAACAMGVDALVDQQLRERKGDNDNAAKNERGLESLER